ncbi:MAG: hypothetical protein ACKV0T_14505 [Planctomycetales bacterium]
MTLPLLRKRPITRRNTPTSVDAQRAASGQRRCAPCSRELTHRPRQGMAWGLVVFFLFWSAPTRAAEPPRAFGNRSTPTAPQEQPTPPDWQAALEANRASSGAAHAKPISATARRSQDAAATADGGVRGNVKSAASARSKGRPAASSTKSTPAGRQALRAKSKSRQRVQPAGYEAEDSAHLRDPLAEISSDSEPAPADDAPAESELPAWPHHLNQAGKPAIRNTDEPEACERVVDEAPIDRLAQARPSVPPSPAPAAEEELTPAQQRLRDQLVRPFKKIHEIRPYFDYEPDGEQAELDRCYNLCPRPTGADCPECQPLDGDGGPQSGLICPECPPEIDLRDTSRYTGQVVDYPVRSFPHFQYCWEPTNLSALPLYFEDFSLERYGHTRHYLIQPVFSAALAATQFVGLPYQMAIDPPWKKRYALGWYRPGQYVPYKYYQIPWNTQAAITEAGVLTGAYFLFAPGVSP